MLKSSRLVSVVFSHLTLLCGLFALPTIGQGKPLTVLNWIPPNSFVPSTTLEALNTDGLLVSGSKSSGTIPMWLCLAASSPSTQCNTTYSFAMVGKNPTVNGSGPTTIDTKIVPILFESSSLKFDAENIDTCSPRKTPALNMVQLSPVFRGVTLPGNKSVGTAQFVSLFQRANFWTFTQPKAASPNYQITLNQVLINAEEKQAIVLGSKSDFTALPYTIAGQVLTDTDIPSTWCDPVAAIEVNDFDSLLQTIIIPALKASGVTPTTLPIFLLGNVVMYDSNLKAGKQCCILGYHNAYFSPTTGATAGKIQTYIVANYDSTGGSNFPGAFPTAPDITALANMVAGWMDNPTTLNTTPKWPGTFSGVSGCQSILEVAYPDPLAAKLTKITMSNNDVYHVQDLAFKSWFYGDIGANNSGFGGVYSLFGNLTVANPPGCL
jgi:hypothetical protein